MLSLSEIYNFMKIDPGHGLLQSLFLFMIWMNSRGIKREIMGLTTNLVVQEEKIKERFEKIETRINLLERGHA